MYINPFVAGILATLLVELLFCIVYAYQHRPGKDMHYVGSVKIDNDDEFKQFTEFLKTLTKENNGEDDND